MLLALAGCAAYPEKPLDPAATRASLEARRLDDAGLAAFIARSGAVSGEAWDFPKLVLAAVYFNPEMEVARAQLRVSEAGIVAAGKRPNPDLDAAAGRASNPPNGEPAGLADIQLAFPFETADKRRHRMAQAEQLAEAARLAIAATAWKVRGQVRDAMLDADAAAAESGILAEQVRVQESDPNAPDIPPREVRRIDTERFIHVEGPRLITRQHPLWPRILPSAGSLELKRGAREQ